ncbi:MAG: hypothetical protein RL654_96 [Pseudomonadota bacterium]|jgi:uncharacterized coiled-coil protein SlyX
MPTPDTRWGDEIEQRLDRGSERMARIEAELARQTEQLNQLQVSLAANTEATEEVRDLLDAAKGAFRALNGLGIAFGWLGRIAAAGVAIWGAIYAMTHGGRPPGGH